jgi:hypothetical protein
VSRITFRSNRYPQEALQNGGIGVDTTPVVTTEVCNFLPDCTLFKSHKAINLRPQNIVRCSNMSYRFVRCLGGCCNEASSAAWSFHFILTTSYKITNVWRPCFRFPRHLPPNQLFVTSLTCLSRHYSAHSQITTSSVYHPPHLSAYSSHPPPPTQYKTCSWTSFKGQSEC